MTEQRKKERLFPFMLLYIFDDTKEMFYKTCLRRELEGFYSSRIFTETRTVIFIHIS